MSQFTKALHAFYGNITRPSSPKQYAVSDKAMRGSIGGALKKTILSIFLVMLVASAMFAPTANRRATTGTTTSSAVPIVLWSGSFTLLPVGEPIFRRCWPTCTKAVRRIESEERKPLVIAR